MRTPRKSILTIAALVGLVILFMIPMMTAVAVSARGLSDNQPAAPTASYTAELIAIDDVDATQRGSHDANYPSSYLVLSKDGQGNYDNIFVGFDLAELPANAVIDSAELHLNVSIFGGAPLDVELARVNGPWDESTITWNNQPTVTLGGPVATISATGDLTWPVTSLVQDWQAGTQPNYGFMLRGTNSSGAAVIADSKESTYGSGTIIPPTLVVHYSLTPPTGARPDLGDAPDSTNHAGITNTAYPGVDGNFPTVYAGTLITEAAGPRHNNLTMEGWLGDYLSREAEADTGPDEDPANNILNGGLNNSNNDRGDDGWRNRNVAFNDCEPTTLRVRVSKSLTATLNKMYLNVWFDGNHDGDWNDEAPCLPQGEQLHIPSTEWIVQDYIVDMTGIAPGGYADININTETVLNTSPHKAHWLRFTLSESRAVSFGGHADGRGPNPANGSFQYGETEDYLQRPAPAGTLGTLSIHKTVAGHFPTEWIDYVTYRVNLRHNGGSQPIDAEMQDALPYPLIVYPTVDGSGVHFVTVESQGSVSPLEAHLDILHNPFQQAVRWRGTLDPNSEITLTFQVRVLALCQPDQQTMTFDNTAQARPLTSTAVITAHVAFDAKCLGYTGNNFTAEWVSPLSYTQSITSVEWYDYRGGGQEDKAVETEAKQGETEAKTEAQTLQCNAGVCDAAHLAFDHEHRARLESVVVAAFR